VLPEGGTGAAAQALATEGPVQLVAMADAFPDQLERSLKRIVSSVGTRKERVAVPPERQFTGFEAYKQLIASDVDLVIMATPPGFRPTHFAASIEAGKHVFCEKPVATDAPGIRQVLAATELAKKKDLAVGVGLQRHHQYSYLETIKRLKDRAIGDIVSMRCDWNSVSEHAHGSKGYANITGGSLQSGETKWRYRGRKNNPFQAGHDDLFAAIRAGIVGFVQRGRARCVQHADGDPWRHGRLRWRAGDLGQRPGLDHQSCAQGSVLHGQSADDARRTRCLCDFRAGCHSGCLAVRCLKNSVFPLCDRGLGESERRLAAGLQGRASVGRW